MQNGNRAFWLNIRQRVWIGPECIGWLLWCVCVCMCLWYGPLIDAHLSCCARWCTCGIYIASCLHSMTSSQKLKQLHSAWLTNLTNYILMWYEWHAQCRTNRLQAGGVRWVMPSLEVIFRYFQRFTSQVLNESPRMLRSFSSLELSNLPLPSLLFLHSVQHSPTFSMKLTTPTARGFDESDRSSWRRRRRPSVDSQFSQFSPASSLQLAASSSWRLLSHQKHSFPGDEKPKSQRVKTGCLQAYDYTDYL